MKRIASLFGAVALSTAMAVTSFVPATAAPIVPVRVIDNNVVNAQFRGNLSQQEFTNWQGQRRWRGGGRHWRGGGRHGWHNGHRGYRHKRPGYRYHNGWWFPGGAFVAGAIIGGALNNATRPPRYRSHGSSHVSWCYDRYRSYRAYDNTFQPYHGPRRQCYSPYS